MNEILFWGATGQAKVLNEALHDHIRLVALVDNRQLGETVLGVPLLNGEVGLDRWLAQRDSSDKLFFTVAVGGACGGDRLMLMDTLERRGLIAHSIIHRTAFVAPDAAVGDGAQILAQAAVCAGAQLGRGVIINTAASVDHDCEIGDGVHIAPGARLAGEIKVGKRTFIGIGSVILPRITIGDDVIIGAGTVVIRDVPSGVTVIGNPARILNK